MGDPFQSRPWHAGSGVNEPFEWPRVYCPWCNGSGFEPEPESIRRADGHRRDVLCDHCRGAGTVNAPKGCAL